MGRFKGGGGGSPKGGGGGRVDGRLVDRLGGGGRSPEFRGGGGGKSPEVDSMFEGSPESILVVGGTEILFLISGVLGI